MKSKIFVWRNKKKTSEIEYLDIDISKEKNKWRYEKRIVEIYDSKLLNIHNSWHWIETIIKVQRVVKAKWKTREELSYYISSLWLETTNAKWFNKAIRWHWSIENWLHYIKDVTMKEDESKVNKWNSPWILSICRNIVLNILRKIGYTNMAKAIRLMCNNIWKMRKVFI